MWGYELSPFVKIVKEVMTELELPYKQVGYVQGLHEVWSRIRQ
jgi:hypothetical protein